MKLIKKNKYDYFTLGRLSNPDECSENLNLYGIIFSISLPKFLEKSQKYMIFLTLFDQYYNPLTGNYKSSKFLPTLIFAKHISQLPTKAEVGNILRIHRCRRKHYKGEDQIICDASRKGSWVLFGNQKSKIAKPIQIPSKNYTFTTFDKNMVENLIDFGKGFFKKYPLDEGCFTLKNCEKKDRVFSIVFLYHIKRLSDKLKLYVFDSTKQCCITISTNRLNPSIKEGKFIKIINFKFKNDNYYSLIQQENSYISLIPSKSKTSLKYFKLIQKSTSKEILILANVHLNKDHPLIASNRFLNKKELTPVTLLSHFPSHKFEWIYYQGTPLNHRLDLNNILKRNPDLNDFILRFKIKAKLLSDNEKILLFSLNANFKRWIF